MDEAAELGLEDLDHAIDQYLVKDPIIKDPSSAMTKRQRKIFEKGVADLMAEDDAVKACIQEEEEYSTKRDLFFIGSPDVAATLSSEVKPIVFDPKKGENATSHKWRKDLEAKFNK